DWREILARVVADAGIERWVDRKRACRDEKRVAVRLGLGDLARGDGASGAAAILDDDALAEARTHALGDDTRDDVIAAAGGVGNDERDRMARVVRSVDRRRAGQNRGQRRSDHSALVPDFLMMADHLASSLSMSAAYCSGVEASGSVP